MTPMSSSFQCGRSAKNDTCLPWQMSMATYFSLLFDDGVSMTVASYTLFGWITLKTVPACPERDLLPLSRAALTAWRGARIARGRVGVPPQVMLPLLPFASNMKPSGQRLLSLCSTTFTLGHQNLGCDWQRYSGTRAQTVCPFYP